MSVLINMKMPKCCCDCRVMDEIDCTCIALNDNSTACFHGKPDWCPLIEVPTPHGRLIDADAMNEKYGDWYTEEGTEEGFIGTLKYLIAEQPTIIEAEE